MNDKSKYKNGDLTALIKAVNYCVSLVLDRITARLDDEEKGVNDVKDGRFGKHT